MESQQKRETLLQLLINDFKLLGLGTPDTDSNTCVYSFTDATYTESIRWRSFCVYVTVDENTIVFNVYFCLDGCLVSFPDVIEELLANINQYQSGWAYKRSKTNGCVYIEFSYKISNFTKRQNIGIYFMEKARSIQPIYNPIIEQFYSHSYQSVNK